MNTNKKLAKRKKKKIDKEFDLELRPHHIKGFAEHEAQPNLYYLSNQEYIKLFRKQKGNFHNDKLILYWRDTLKKLHENLGLRFKFVLGLDSVCKQCERKESCHYKKHQLYKIVQKADRDAINSMPELKSGRIYDGHYLRKLFKTKGWLKK